MGNLIKADSVGRVASWQVHLVNTQKNTDKEEVRQASPDEEAQLLIDNAREQAEAMVAEAESEVDSIRKAAYQQGYDEVMAEFETAREAVKRKITELEEDAASQLDEFWRTIEPEILRLALDITSKIVRRELDASDASLIEIVKVGLHQVKERREIKIRVHPSQFEFTREHKDDIIVGFDDVKSVDLIEDRRITRGGCIIEAIDGQLDARIETQLQKAENALMEEMHKIDDSSQAA